MLQYRAHRLRSRRCGSGSFRSSIQQGVQSRFGPRYAGIRSVGNAAAAVHEHATILSHTLVKRRPVPFVGRMIIWPRLKACRFAVLVMVSSAGIVLSRALLGEYALLCVLAAAGWCLICIVALRLVYWDDWSRLELARQPDASQSIESLST